MKRNVVLSLIAVGLTLLPFASSKAFETAVTVGATPITGPITITTSGNYYLPANLTFTGVGAAIVVTASEVVIDLNGRSLASTPGNTAFNEGVYVANGADVTIQNGDIDNFGYAGVLFADTQKCVVDKVNFNNDSIGVLNISGSSNLVKNCIIDGGDTGIYFWADLGGSRASNNTLENQKAAEFPGMGVAIFSAGGTAGTYFENNLVSKTGVGQMLGSVDKYRFETFVDGATRVGGIDQMATSVP